MKSFLASPRREFFFLILLPFLLWVFCLWNFFSFKMTFIKDAVSYFEHISFFTDNLMRGVFPLWHPDWTEGAVSYNFFLRRIGDVNPFFWLIILFKAVGVKAVYAHLTFLALYFFMGAVAFWLIARIIFRDSMMAVTAYLLLLFSSWGGQLFFTYIVILFTPILWFFYFLLAFAKEQKNHQFLGTCFCIGILATTYIPFFFLTILMVVGILFAVFFFKISIDFIVQTTHFLGRNRWCFILGILYILISCVPALNFYKESKEGGFVLPGRHAGATDQSVLTVNRQLAMEGDLITQGYFENIFENQSVIRIESFFISFFFFMILALSIINPITRRGAFFLTTAFVLTIISVTESTPLYKFLLEHIFFLKFMRNIYYLFWLAILPLAILFAVEQLKVFLKSQQGKKRVAVIVFIVIIHVVAGMWLGMHEGILWTTWVTLAASLLFLCAVIQGYGKPPLTWLLLIIALLIQPAHVLHTMSVNGVLSDENSLNHSGIKSFDKFMFDRQLSYQDASKSDKEVYLQEMQRNVYYANRLFTNILTYVPEHQRLNFMQHRLYLADNTTIYEDDSPQFFRKMGGLWESEKNVVFLAPNKVQVGDVRFLPDAPEHMEPVTKLTSSIKVVSFDVNTLNIKSNLTRSRFLVWTDSYDAGWHVYINGKEGKIFQTFHAFKGIWIPEGENTILFRYASSWRYVGQFLLMTIFIFMLAAIVYWSRREGFLLERNTDDTST